MAQFGGLVLSTTTLINHVTYQGCEDDINSVSWRGCEEDINPVLSRGCEATTATTVGPAAFTTSPTGTSGVSVRDLSRQIKVRLPRASSLLQ